jgi:N-acyl-D-amino-acid deacylase
VPRVAPAQPGNVPAGFEPLDNSFRAFLQTNALPGASLAIAKDGRLVFAKSYGYSDVANADSVQPDSLFRFGSIGKTITATAVMKLVESGKLSLDDKAFRIVSNITPRSGHLGDPRLALVTIRNLLTHSGGWDAAASGDPIVAPFSERIAVAMGVPFPPEPNSIISYMLDQPLDFDPGSRFAYSNLGFLVLGRVIEQVSGQPFADFVQQQISAPLRIRRMRLGRTPLSLRAPGEVQSYDYPGAPLVDSLMPGVAAKVPEPYSGIVALESIDSAGGWIASPIDLVRIVTMLDGWGTPILAAESVQQMVTPVFTLPGVGLDAGRPLYVGLGIGMDSPAEDATWAHDGGTFGTRAFICRPGHGWAWAVTFNSSPQSALYSSTGSADFDAILRRLFSREALESVSWFGGDLFQQYLPSVRQSRSPNFSPRAVRRPPKL